jgi:hypothetical protein
LNDDERSDADGRWNAARQSGLLVFLWVTDKEQSQTAQPRSDLRVKLAGSIRLTDELPGPIEEGAELIRVGHEIDNQRHRGQHEDCISHEFYPAPTC